MKKNMLFTGLSTGVRKVCGLSVMSAVLMFGTCLSAPSGAAHAAVTPEVIKVTLGKAQVIPMPGNVSDIMVADPKVTDVSALKIDQLYVVGSTLGDTNIILLDEKGNVLRNLNINVGIDTEVIENLIHTAFPAERGVNVHVVGNQVALMGSVSTPSVAQKIAKLVASRVAEVRKTNAGIDDLIENLLEVRGEQQVTLRVRILEVSRNVLKELGVETGTGSATNTTTGIRPKVTITDGIGLTKDSFAVSTMLFNSGFGTIGDIALKLNALETDGLANVLAEPNLTAVSGEKAGFLAGGEFPVPSGRDQYGNIIIDYKQFGVSLNFKPTVMSEDRISLQLDTEVSSLNQGQGITLSEIVVPGIDVRRASTTVEINSGGSLMMAGLLKSDNVKGMSGLPGIKETPVLGDLVSSKSFNREETELVVIVTPYLVQPFADTAQAKPIMESDLGELLPPPPPVLANVDKGKTKTALKPEEAKQIADERNLPETPVEDKKAPMSNVFGNNMKKIYGDKVNVPSGQAFGYLND